MDLFEYAREKQKETESPLASRLRPETLEEVAGQQHIIGKDKLLYRAIKADKLSSVIFYGPPGTGKTDACQSHRQCNKRKILPDQRDGCREKRYGSGGGRGKKGKGNVPAEDDSVYR